MSTLSNYLYFILLFLSSFLSAQTGSRPPRGVLPDSVYKAYENELPDSINLKYYLLSDIDKTYQFKDSTLDGFFHQYDPAHRRDIDYLTLGNVGSAARSLLYKNDPYIGFATGRNQYDLYNFTKDDFKFYTNTSPVSNVFFTPVSDQDNFVIRADFARSYDDGTAISLNYRRIRQAGFYQNQLTKDTNLGISIRFGDNNEKYSGYITYLSNVIEEGQNGGVTIQNYAGQGIYDQRLNVPVYSTDAQTRHQQKKIILTQYYQLGKPFLNKYKVLAQYDLSYDASYYKFTDPTTDAENQDTLYGQYNFEDRGIRVYDKIRSIKNSLYTNLTDGSDFTIKLGLTYDYIDINQQSFKSHFDNAFLSFNGDIPIFESISIDTDAKLGILDASGDFLIQGRLNLDFGKWFKLNGGVRLFRSTPELVYRQLVVNDEIFYSNDFVKPFGTQITGEFEISALNLRGELQQSLITNALYFDEAISPSQFESVFTATSLKINQNLNFWKFTLENYVGAQVFSENIYNLPRLYSKHNLFFETHLFDKALLSRFGTEVRLNPQYEGAGFQPVVGNFYATNDEIPFLPVADFYFSGKVSKFRIFVRYENYTQLIFNDINYETNRYPQFDTMLRMGVGWLLFD